MRLQPSPRGGMSRRRSMAGARRIHSPLWRRLGLATTTRLPRTWKARYTAMAAESVFCPTGACS